MIKTGNEVTRTRMNTKKNLDQCLNGNELSLSDNILDYISCRCGKFCEDQKISCHECDSHICDDCVENIKSYLDYDKVCCPECLRLKESDKYYCSDCSHFCKDCEEYFCVKHLQYCSECGDLYCDDCNTPDNGYTVLFSRVCTKCYNQ